MCALREDPHMRATAWEAESSLWSKQEPYERGPRPALVAIKHAAPIGEVNHLQVTAMGDGGLLACAILHTRMCPERHPSRANPHIVTVGSTS